MARASITAFGKHVLGFTTRCWIFFPSPYTDFPSYGSRGESPLHPVLVSTCNYLFNYSGGCERFWSLIIHSNPQLSKISLSVVTASYRPLGSGSRSRPPMTRRQVDSSLALRHSTRSTALALLGLLTQASRRLPSSQEEG